MAGFKHGVGRLSLDIDT